MVLPSLLSQLPGDRRAARGAGIIFTYECVREGCLKFGPAYAKSLKKRQGRFADAWHLNEAVLTIHGAPQSLWRTVEYDGDTIDILVQQQRKKKAAARFFPHWLFTDKLRRHAAAHRVVMPTGEHRNPVYANTRVAVAPQPTRQRA